jgi:hypothetical protein
MFPRRFMPHFEAGEGLGNVTNFNAASQEPYAQVLERLGLDTPAETPLQAEMHARPAEVQPEQRPLQGLQTPLAQPAEAAPVVPPVAAPAIVGPYDDPVPAGPAVPAEEIPSWAQPLFAQNQQSAQIMQALAEAINETPQAAPAIAPQTPGAEEYDPFDPESFQRAVDARAREQFEQLYQERLAPFEEVLNIAAQRESVEAAHGYYERIEPQVGKFDHDMAHTVGVAFQALAPDMPPEQALWLSATVMHEYEKGLWQKFQESLGSAASNAVGAPSEAPAAAAAVSEVLPVPTGPERYTEAARRFMERRNVSGAIA